MGSTPYVLEPLGNDNGVRGPRLEIDEFLMDNDMSNLFLQALRNLQRDSLKQVNGGMNMFNHYALSAIHAAPREEWNGYENTTGKYGYCHHSLDTFPTWHRPYMMAYEIAIYKEMVKVANLYTDTEQSAVYRKAAARFRLPYWDPIMPRNERAGDLDTVFGLPVIFQQKEIYVRTPTEPNVLKPIPNPFYEFAFPEDTEWDEHSERPRVDFGNAYNRRHTVRTPNENGEADLAYLDLKVRRQANSLAVRIWKMLNPDEYVNKVRPWNSFANDTVLRVTIQNRQFATESVEGWHDSIHVLVGQSRWSNSPYQGHMGNPTYAAFDPIFWMHHNNIDRLLSLYQALYGRNVEGKLVAQELIPFTKDAKTRKCFTSEDDLVKNYWSPGFAVPGTEGSKSGSVKDVVKRYLTDTYYWATDKDFKGKVPLANWPKDVKNLSEAISGRAVKKNTDARVLFTSISAKSASPKLVQASAPISASIALQEPIQIDETPIKLEEVLNTVNTINGNLPEKAMIIPDSSTSSTSQEPVQQIWDAHIKVRKFAFDGSFSVHVFIGWVKDDQTERFFTKKNEVGFTGVFVAPVATSTDCQSCQQNRADDATIESVVPLTTYLTDYLESNPKSQGLITEGNLRTLRSMEPEDVVPFLKEHIQWRILDLSSNLLVGREQEAHLEVAVTHRTFAPPDAQNLLGVYGEPTEYPDITNDKAGGLGYVYPTAGTS